jgi:hypothetical protein
MFSTAPALEKPGLEKPYRDLIVALVSAFGLGMDVIKAIDHYRHMGPKISPEFIVVTGLVLLILLVTSVRALVRSLRTENSQK